MILYTTTTTTTVIFSLLILQPLLRDTHHTSWLMLVGGQSCGDVPPVRAGLPFNATRWRFSKQINRGMSNSSPTATQDNGSSRTKVEWGAVSNLANTAIGAGVLSFPFAYSLTGLGFGVLLTISFAIVCSISQSWVATFQRRTKTESYEELIGVVFQSKGVGTLMQVMVFVYQLGACVAYILVFCDQATPLIKYVAQEAKANGNDSAFLRFVDQRGTQVFFVSAFLMLPPPCSKTSRLWKRFLQSQLLQ